MGVTFFDRFRLTLIQATSNLCLPTAKNVFNSYDPSLFTIANSMDFYFYRRRDHSTKDSSQGILLQLNLAAVSKWTRPEVRYEIFSIPETLRNHRTSDTELESWMLKIFWNHCPAFWLVLADETAKSDQLWLVNKSRSWTAVPFLNHVQNREGFAEVSWTLMIFHLN